MYSNGIRSPTGNYNHLNRVIHYSFSGFRNTDIHSILPTSTTMKSFKLSYSILSLSLLISIHTTATFAFGVWQQQKSTRIVRTDAVKVSMVAKRRGANNLKKAAGFSAAKEQVTKEQQITTKEQSSTTGNIYSMPALYDLAFGYRNFEDEVDFLLFAHQKYSSTGQAPRSVIELAAGPARHAIESLRMKQSPIQAATAIDYSQDMVNYGTTLADNELKHDLRSSFQYLRGDMRDFTTFPHTFDTAWILLGSLQHMTTNKDALACFRTIHSALNPGGTLILELPHPRETFTMVECTRNGWEVPLNDGTDGELQIVWGDDDDTFDPIRQVRDFTVQMKVVGGEQDQFIKEIVPMRQYTAQEIDALATLAGFQVAGMYGALYQDVDVNDEEQAFRLVCVLHKRDK